MLCPTISTQIEHFKLSLDLYFKQNPLRKIILLTYYFPYFHTDVPNRLVLYYHMPSVNRGPI